MNTLRRPPLAGITVPDLGQIYQAPYAGFLMAKAGANVIKIEPIEGESTRQRSNISKGSSIPFAMLNGNKRSLSLNLKSDQGRELLKRLAKQSDVLVENFAPGVMDRLGVGWSVMSEINSRLIYASATGFGISGSDRDRLAMDVTVQAVSGMMSVTGFPDGPPVKAGPAVADFISGTHLYGGILTALFERVTSGTGCLVEIAMQETIYPTLASNLGMIYDKGIVPPRTGNRHGGLAAAPYNVYAASDGFVAIICINDRQWQNLLRAMDRRDLQDDSRFLTKAARVQNMDEVDSLISSWAVAQTRNEVFDNLERHKVPSALVRDLIEVTNDPNLHARGMLQKLDHPEFGAVVLPNSPLRLHGMENVALVPSSRLGEHNREVLMEMLGMAPEDVDKLEVDGVIRRPPLS